MLELSKRRVPTVYPATLSRASGARLPSGRFVAPNRPRVYALSGKPSVMLEEGTTNITSQLVSAWEQGSFDGTGNPVVSVTRLRTINFTNLTGGTTYSISCAGGYNYIIKEYNSSGTLTFDSASWTGLAQTYLAKATTAKFKIHVSRVDGAVMLLSEISSVQIQVEVKPYATSFIDGSRSVEVLTIPTAGIISPTQGCIRQWVYINSTARRQVGVQYNRVLDLPQTTGGPDGISVWHNAGSPSWHLKTTNDALTVTSASCSDTLTPDGWHLFVVKWCSAEAKLLIDGVASVTIANPALPSIFGGNSWLAIGSRVSSPTDFLNTSFGQTLISNDYPNDSQLLAEYNASALTGEAITTNLLTANQSNIETDLTGLSSNNGGSISRVTTEFYSGIASVRVVTPGTSNGEGVTTTNNTLTSTTQGLVHTASCYVKGASGTIIIEINERDSGGALIGSNSQIITLNGSWQRISASRVLSVGPKVSCKVTTGNVTQAITFYVDALQIEQGPNATTWMQGGTTRVNTLINPRIKTKTVDLI